MQATQEVPEGSWTCSCGNVNYPTRIRCNRRGCTLPKPGAVVPVPEVTRPGNWICKCGNENFAHRTECNKRTCGLPRAQSDISSGGRSQAQGLSAGTNWFCVCGNENWPQRPTCNKRTCGLPRQQGDVAARGGLGAAPVAGGAANWRCVCGNENYPTRMMCNMRACKLPRTQGDIALRGGAAPHAGPYAPAAGPLGPRAARPAPLGSWKCSCGNINFPKRDTCNKNNCGNSRLVSEVVDEEILKSNMLAAAAAQEFDEAARLKREIEAMEMGQRYAPY
mmetsp:Transcript_76878/g.205465  ORF Transcript_76878/g.205465 Transcript_76878/m.205465 type:complete len:278 (+) Transcript_76878:76-909(+)